MVSELVIVNPRKKSRRATSKTRKVNKMATRRRTTTKRKAPKRRRTTTKRRAPARRKTTRRKSTRRSTTKRRSTAARRSAAARKAAKTRAANKRRRSLAAKKAAATRRRKTSRRKTSRRKTTKRRKSPSRRRTTRRKTSRRKSPARRRTTRRKTSKRRGTARRRRVARRSTTRSRKMSMKNVYNHIKSNMTAFESIAALSIGLIASVRLPAMAENLLSRAGLSISLTDKAWKAPLAGGVLTGALGYALYSFGVVNMTTANTIALAGAAVTMLNLANGYFGLPLPGIALQAGTSGYHSFGFLAGDTLPDSGNVIAFGGLSGMHDAEMVPMTGMHSDMGRVVNVF